MDISASSVGRMLLAECEQEGVEPYADGISPPSSAAAAAPAPPPEQEPPSTVEFAGVPWCFNRHSVVQASVVSAPGGPDIPAGSSVLFCMQCGASVGSHFSRGHGLDALCQGKDAPGLRTQRARLRKGQYPGRQDSRLEAFRAPSQELRDHWTARLPSLAGVGALQDGLGQHAVSSGGGCGTGSGYGLQFPAPLIDFEVARLHGFDDPSSVVSFISDFKGIHEAES